MQEAFELNLSNIEEAYQIGGPLSENISGYVYREQQVQLAKKISSTLKNNKILLAEAGTGTGKTLAYLVPALLSSNKTVISTGTKNLQNQLYFRDLPMAIRALRMPVKTALLKGRANYLCKYRLELALTDLLLANSEQVVQFKQIVIWSESTDDGDISTVPDIPEDSEVWNHVTSTPDNCLAQDCPFINKCFVYRARQAALDAKIVVINHHLLLSDWGIKSEQVDAKLLPDGINLILDEAHQLAHIASNYFGVKVSSKQIRNLLQDIAAEQKQNAKDQKILLDCIKETTNSLDRLQKYLSDKAINSDRSDNSDRGFYRNIYNDDYFRYDLTNLTENIRDLNKVLQNNAERSKGLELCYERCLELLSNLDVFSNLDKEKDKKNNNDILWYETYKFSFIFKQTPLEINKLFADKLEEMAKSSVFTSATITVMNDFSLIKNDLGLTNADTIKILSPFNYQNKSILYIPRDMPDPRSDSFIDSYVEQVLPVLECCKGGVFLLFTSYNAMYLAYEKLRERLSTIKSPLELLMQGEASKTALLEKFTNNNNQVLLATASFWEGIDVKGNDLHCVVIDKLPFTAPNDPVLQSKINQLRKQGKNPFIDLQCQQAALHLVQGAGRLIRSEQDYGVLMICDPRIISKPYGQIFLKTLPDMPRTRNIEKIRDFYQQYLL